MEGDDKGFDRWGLDWKRNSGDEMMEGITVKDDVRSGSVGESFTTKEVVSLCCSVFRVCGQKDRGMVYFYIDIDSKGKTTYYGGGGFSPY